MGGLIYPLSKEINIDKAHSINLFENQDINTKFIIDGIYITKEMSISDINEKENEFLLRIENLIDID